MLVDEEAWGEWPSPSLGELGLARGMVPPPPALSYALLLVDHAVLVVAVGALEEKAACAAFLAKGGGQQAAGPLLGVIGRMHGQAFFACPDALSLLLLVHPLVLLLVLLLVVGVAQRTVWTGTRACWGGASPPHTRVCGLPLHDLRACPPSLPTVLPPPLPCPTPHPPTRAGKGDKGGGAAVPPPWRRGPPAGASSPHHFAHPIHPHTHTGTTHHTTPQPKQARQPPTPLPFKPAWPNAQTTPVLGRRVRSRTLRTAWSFA